MQLKTNLTILFIAFALSVPGHSQDTSRWIKFPDRSQPEIIRHPLNESAKSGTILRLRFETDPASPLLRMINKSFPEAVEKATSTDNVIDVGKSTIFLEEMQREAEQYLLIASDTVASDTASETRSLF